MRSPLFFLTAVGLFISISGWAESATVSPFRFPNETLEESARRSGLTYSPSLSSDKQEPVLDVAEEYWSFDPTDVPLWSNGSQANLAELTLSFLEIRDQRIYQDTERPGWPRRMAFLFPDDGCHVRAALFNQELEKRGLSRGHKIFAFGSIRIPSSHHPDGEVLWWFHVAPIFKLPEGLYVADPALFPSAPIRLKDWLKFLAPDRDLTQLRMVTCDAFAHNPASRCMGGSTGMDKGAIKQHNDELLHYEWVRQERLGRDPVRILGDFPPWREN